MSICGAVYDKYGLDPAEYDGVKDMELLMYDIPGFNNVGQAFLTIFQILTLESWVNLMYNYSDASGSALSTIFFILVILIGTFFTMNLLIATIVEAY